MPALIQSETGRTLSWRQLDAEADALAGGLLSLGLRHGDKLAIWCVNRAEWIIAFCAAARIGMIVVTANINYQAAEMACLLNLTETDALLFMDSYKKSNQRAVAEKLWGEGANGRADRVPSLRTMIYTGAGSCPFAVSFDDLPRMGRETPASSLAESEAAVSPEDVINLQFTSGTTRTPKAVMLTHLNLVNNSRLTGERMRLGERDRLCLAVPLFHCFGLSSGVMVCMGTGACMVLVEMFRSRKVMEAVRRYRCTVLHGVPTMFLRVLQNDAFADFDLGSLRTGILAGATINGKLFRSIVEKMHLPELAVAYGLTETSPGCTQTMPDDPVELRASSIGWPFAGVEMQVRDPATGALCPPGEIGELCTRGPHVIKGYYGQPEMTAEVLDQDGWLHTGDAGFMDENGLCHFTARLKDIIIRGGENISPGEVENAISGHPAVRDVKVYGVFEQPMGEEVAASVLLFPQAALTGDDLRVYLNGRLACFKIPKYIEFVSAFPLTGSGKVRMAELRAAMQKKIETTHCHDQQKNVNRISGGFL